MSYSKNTRYTLFFYFIVSLFFVFSSYAMQEQQTDRCPICWDIMLQEPDTLIQLSCHSSHTFHKLCFQQWLTNCLWQHQIPQCLYCHQELSIKDKLRIDLYKVEAEVLRLYCQQLMIYLGNSTPHLPPLEPLLYMIKQEVYKLLSPLSSQEDIEHFIAHLPAIQPIIRNLNPQTLLDFVKQVCLSYIETFNIHVAPYEQSSVHFTLLGRLVSLSLAYILPAIKHYLITIQTNLLYNNFNQDHYQNPLDQAQIRVIVSILNSFLEQLDNKDIAELTESLFTQQLDRQNWDITKTLIIRNVYQLNNKPNNDNFQCAYTFIDTFAKLCRLFVQLNPNVQAALEHLPQHYTHLIYKKSIVYKLNKPWIKSAALVLCSTAFIKLCEYAYNNWS